ncbi:hypothetical protein BEWA_002650 [Theileria equi strain WA]|uniref:Uncharacterized protein n=1 Tax=Theileria equi strain WA TaxID=1537102 RepID=L0B031_THEEQ|nr:hypothetical protein BEWA_002650 [Theileria equi strain WA]AFZ80858.1 hypothetical protein BEWA_002650 [Theileria equi strain WA]|eukprot:XP_004830524.1 hypothetical protein BEWA_002650 [Theileria equi strain WA]
MESPIEACSLSDDCPSSEGSDTEQEYAYSLFDDYKSIDTSRVYEYMKSEFGFDYNALGSGTLHRVALINYLETIKNDGGNVLEAYKEVVRDPQIILGDFEKFIKPPFYNEKLIWGFMESSDEEDNDEVILKKSVNVPERP